MTTRSITPRSAAVRSGAKVPEGGEVGDPDQAHPVRPELAASLLGYPLWWGTGVEGLGFRGAEHQPRAQDEVHAGAGDYPEQVEEHVVGKASLTYFTSGYQTAKFAPMPMMATG